MSLFNLRTRFNETNRKMKMNELNLVEEHLNSNNSPFRFNAKELDATERIKNVQRTFLAKGRACRTERNYYYGARYGVYPEHSRRDPKFSIWISVDPLAEQAPDWTPYRYGFNNPIKYIDPDGMFEYPGNCCPIPKEVKEFGNFLSNLVLDIFGLKPKKNKSETKKKKGLIWRFGATTLKVTA